MTVLGDEIEFDFSKSSAQTAGFTNCSYGALVGSVATGMNPMLAWDLPFNQGVLGPVMITAAESSIVNPSIPAPASNGHLTTGARVTRLVTLLLNRAVERSADAELRRRAQGIWADSWTRHLRRHAHRHGRVLRPVQHGRRADGAPERSRPVTGSTAPA